MNNYDMIVFFPFDWDETDINEYFLDRPELWSMVVGWNWMGNMHGVYLKLK